MKIVDFLFEGPPLPSEEEGTIYFNIVFHHHQPVGNFPWVIEEIYQKSYLPLIQTIAEYPKIKTNLHYSGFLLLWLQKNHPEYLKQVLSLINSNQVEIVGGGFFEPILGFIPEKDRKLQIQMLNSWWKDNYNIKTNGIWLAERVWVPNLPPVLHDLNGEFVYLDENIFRNAGLSETETFYAYVTEDQGKEIVAFPINEQIRYLIPWKPPDITLKYLAKNCDPNHKKIIVMMSDAEKMGAWQAGNRTTHDICYVSGYDGKPWMKSFFEQIGKNKWIKPILISNYLEKHSPIGLIYLPTGSYDKMSEWVLPSDLRKKYAILKEKPLTEEKFSIEEVGYFLKGSIWQKFLVKYSQANIMHKRMLFTRKKLERAESELLNRFPDEIQEIWDNILASQANDGYGMVSSVEFTMYFYVILFINILLTQIFSWINFTFRLGLIFWLFKLLIFFLMDLSMVFLKINSCHAIFHPYMVDQFFP